MVMCNALKLAASLSAQRASCEQTYRLLYTPCSRVHLII